MKLFLKLAIVALVLFGLLGLAGWLLVPPAAKSAVERGSTYAFGVPTTLAKLDASLGFSTSGLALEGYAVQSPKGFEGKPLLAIDKLAFAVGTRSLTGEPKVVDELVLEGLELNLVQKGTQSNLWPVLQQVRKVAGGKAEPDPGAGEESGSPGPRIQVRRVRIAGLAANIDVSGIPGVEPISKRFELPAYDADWSQLTGTDGLTVAELSGKLMEEVTQSTLSEADKHLPSAAMVVVRATLEGGLSGGAGGALDAARGAVEDKAKEELLKLEEKGKELEKKAKEKVNELLGPGTSALERGQEQAAELIGGDAAEAVGSELEKAAEKATEKAGKALEGTLPDAKKKLFGGLKAGGGGQSTGGGG
jgi:hypothetical protein